MDRQKGASYLIWWLVPFAFVLGLHPIHESDPYWHMTLGRSVLEFGSRVVPEPAALPAFSPTAIVPEWLWGVVTYGLYQAGGSTLLSFFAATLAALSAFLVIRWCLVSSPDSSANPSPWGPLLVASLTVLVLFARLRLRPQAVFLCFLPAFLLVAQKVNTSKGKRGRTWGWGAVGLMLVWAQFHGSFVLAPALFFLQTVPLKVAKWGSYLKRYGLILFALSLALFSSAQGFDVLLYVTEHASGDAKHFILDMRELTWAHINPFVDPFFGALVVLWVVGLLGLAIRREFPVRQGLLALFGLALMTTAVRFGSAAAILTAPLALHSLSGLSTHWEGSPLFKRGAFALGFALLGWFTWGVSEGVHQIYGPIGGSGWAIEKHPFRGIRRVEQLPQGSAVYTDFDAGGPVGFHLAGHVGITLDSRTPLYFDETEYGMAREGMRHALSLQLQAQHHGIDAAVVARTTEPCASFASSGWVLAEVDARFSTFLPPGSKKPLLGLRPCGRDYVERGCPSPEAVDASLKRIEIRGEGRFTRYLRAEQLLQCGGKTGEALKILREYTPHTDTWRRAHERSLALALIETGALDSAFAILEKMAEHGDLGLTGLVLSPSLKGKRQNRKQKVLELMSQTLLDDFPPELRAELAQICMGTEDMACARFHGFRAAALGQISVAPVMFWLSQIHEKPHVRKEAKKWTATLMALKATSQRQPGADAQVEPQPQSTADPSAPGASPDPREPTYF